MTTQIDKHQSKVNEQSRRGRQRTNRQKMLSLSSSSQDSQVLDEEMMDAIATNRAAMGLLSLRGIGERSFRNRSPTLPTVTSSAHNWSTTEAENTLLKMQLKRKDLLLKDAYRSILVFCQQHPPLLEHLKDMLPSTGQWSEGMRQDLIYRMNALKLELEAPKSHEYDWNNYQEKIKLEMQCLGNAIKMIIEGAYNNNMEMGEEKNGVGVGDDMMYEMFTPATISIVGASTSPPPPPTSTAINTENLFTSAAEEEEVTNPQIHEHVIDKSKAKLGFFCTCGMEFRSKDDLVYHIKVESASTGVASECTTCKVCFSSLEELIAHRKSVHKILPSFADLEKVSLNQAPVRPSREFQANPVDNLGSSSYSAFDDSSIQELIEGPPSGQVHKADVTKSHLGAYCVCGHLCSSRNALQHHTWYRTNVDRIRCDFCPRTYPGYSYLLRHQYSAHRHTPPSFPNTDEVAIVSAASVSTMENLESPQCKRNFEIFTPGFSQPHQPNQRANRVVHGINAAKQRNGLFPCLCKEKFKKLRSLENHIQIFTKDPALPCKMCDTRFYNIKYLRSHMSKKHKIPPKGYLKGCHDCGLVFEENWKYLDHLKTVHKSGPLYGINKVRNANRRKLAKTEQVSHGLQDVILIPDDDDDTDDTSDGRSDSGSASSSSSVFYCKCSKSFSSMSALDEHTRESTLKLVFKCEWCPKRFNAHAGLKLHMSSSHKEISYNMKYGCNDCGKTFETRKELMSHRLDDHRQSRVSQFQVAASEVAVQLSSAPMA